MTTQPGVGISISDLHQSVSDIARVMLDRPNVDPAVDLFDQGATSLAFIRMLAKMNEMYGITVDVAALEEASIDSLAALVHSQVTGKTRS